MNKLNIRYHYKNIPVLSSLTDQNLKKLIDNSHLVHYETGSNIIEQGDKTDSVYFLISGTVHVIDYSRLDRAVTYASLKEGDMFGEMAVIDGLPRSAWVSAVTPCDVICLTGEIFLELVQNDNKLCFILLKQLSSRIRRADERISEVAVLGTEQRACVELIRMLKPNKNNADNYVIENMPTQANFANMIGSTRETVSRIFSKLREDSIIIKTENGYIIPDRKNLEKKAFN